MQIYTKHLLNTMHEQHKHINTYMKGKYYLCCSHWWIVCEVSKIFSSLDVDTFFASQGASPVTVQRLAKGKNMKECVSVFRSREYKWMLGLAVPIHLFLCVIFLVLCMTHSSGFCTGPMCTIPTAGNERQIVVSKRSNFMIWNFALKRSEVPLQ